MCDMRRVVSAVTLLAQACSGLASGGAHQGMEPCDTLPPTPSQATASQCQPVPIVLGSSLRVCYLGLLSSC